MFEGPEGSEELLDELLVRATELLSEAQRTSEKLSEMMEHMRGVVKAYGELVERAKRTAER